MSKNILLLMAFAFASVTAGNEDLPEHITKDDLQKMNVEIQKAKDEVFSKPVIRVRID